MKNTEGKTKYNYVSEARRFHYFFKNGEEEMIYFNPVFMYWNNKGQPDHKTKCKIQDFSGLKGITLSEMYKYFNDRKIDFDTNDTYHYLKDNNYYLTDRYGIVPTPGDGMRFEGVFTAEDVLKIDMSCMIMNFGIEQAAEKNDMSFSEAAVAMCYDDKCLEVLKSYFAKEFRDEMKFDYPDINMNITNSVIDEYFEFALPYTANGFRCPDIYPYRGNVEESVEGSEVA